MLKKVLFSGVVLCSLFCAAPTLLAQGGNGGFVYFLDEPSAQSGTILGDSINSRTGALTPISGLSVEAQFSIDSRLAATPSGHFLYALEYVSGTGFAVASYSIASNTGQLTEVAGSPFFAENTDIGPRWLAMHPLGRFLYLMNAYYDQIFAYAIDQNTGALTEVAGSPFATQYAYATFFTLDATGQYAYLGYATGRSNAPTGAISAYKIDPDSGSFTLVAGSPFLLPTDPSAATQNGPYPLWAASHPSAGYLYVADSNQLDLWTFTIDGATGALTLSRTSPLHMPHGFNQFAIDPSGRFAYFTTLYPDAAECPNCYPNSSVYAPDSVFVYAIDPSNGVMSPSNSPMQAAGYQPYPVAVDSSGRFAYVLNLQGHNFDPNSSNISAFRIQQGNGGLTQIHGSPFSAGAHAAQTMVVTRAPNRN